jgi:integrase
MIRLPMPGLSWLTVSNRPEARMTRGWHQVNGKWARSLGERGIRVRLFQMTKGGPFYRDVWRSGRGKHRKSLGTRDRPTAERKGRELLAMLRQGMTVAVTPLTLGELVAEYQTSCPGYLARTEVAKVDARSRCRVLEAHFGSKCVVRELTAADIASYVNRRIAGGIRVSEDWTTAPTRPRSAAADVTLLSVMCNWAKSTRVNGSRLLESNPLAGIRAVRDVNPRRPVATEERYLATRKAMRQLATEAMDSRSRVRWQNAELALVLARVTGRRLGAIRQLRWEDVQWNESAIRWRAENDKKRREWLVPAPPALIAELRGFQRERGAVGGWVLANTGDPPSPISRHDLAATLEKAESRANLPKLEGSLWHAYRRLWATKRKHLPVADVAAAGGWQGPSTLLTCYQQATPEAMLKVMNGADRRNG